AGIILGTAAYMSPEQAAGKTVDKRSDLWAFGVVLMEMLTGRQVFKGETVSHVLAAVLTQDPDWTTLPPGTPASIRRLLRRCLERDRRQRLSDAAMARLEIADAQTVDSSSPTERISPRRVAAMVIGSVLAGAVVATLAASAWTRPALTPMPLTRLTIALPPTLPLTASLQASSRVFAVAPDGSFLVYRAGSNGLMVVRPLDQLDASSLPGVVDVLDLAVSPDSRWICYVEGYVLKKIAVSGGAPVTLARLPSLSRGLSWIDDSSIIIGTNSPTAGLLRVPAGGGEPTVVTIPNLAQGELGHLLPSALPGGRAVLFTIGAARPDDSQIALLDLSTGQRTMLLRGGTDAQYVASGHLVYATAGGLSAVRFDVARRAVVGTPVRVIDRLGASGNGAQNASTTNAGTLIYLPEGVGDARPRLLVWVDRQGRETPITAPPRAYFTARIAPDGTRVAVSIRDQEQDIWVWDLSRQTLTRLTLDPLGDLAPTWTRDSRRIVFASTRTGVYNLYSRAADGTGADMRLTTSGNTQVPDSMTPDGAFVIGREVRTKTKADVVRVALNRGDGGATAADALVETPFDEWNADVSPDGRFIAYQSAESGQLEVYVQPYPHVANGRWQVSINGGYQPAWTRGGRELVYIDAGDHLVSVSVDTTTAIFHASRPTTLFTTTYVHKGSEEAFRSYDVSPDGQRFLMIKEGASGTAIASVPHFVVVEHWFEELKRLAPARQ
ncbi:MAG: protein kinase, partial [Vicinamibacterales bacterium]